MSRSDTPCQATVVGIQVHYCVDGQRQPPVWLDLEVVKALTWCTGDAIPAKGANTSSGHSVPTTTRAKNCPHDVSDEPDSTSLCWWDGTEWVCGTL